MLGKIIGAAVGNRVADHFSRRVGGGTGALVGAGLMSRRFRGLALAGLAAAGAAAAYKSYKSRRNGEDYRP
jgi:hypothetical protein